MRRPSRTRRPCPAPLPGPDRVLTRFLPGECAHTSTPPTPPTQLDLCSLASVAEAAATFKSRHKALHLLINNAAVMGTAFATTPDGFEEQMAATHFGHFALTGHLIELLRASAPARVVTVSSMMHEYSGELDLENINAQRSAWSIYCNAKLANLLFTLELTKRLVGTGVLAVAAHPGYTATNLQYGAGPAVLMAVLNGLMAQDVTVGAQPLLYAALGEDIDSGDYCGPAGMMSGPATKCKRAKLAEDEAAAAKLWAKSAELPKMDYLS